MKRRDSSIVVDVFEDNLRRRKEYPFKLPKQFKMPTGQQGGIRDGMINRN